MRTNTWIAFLCLTVLGCGWDRDLTEYSLDEKSFDAETLAEIEQESGIDLPDGAKGLAYHYEPPIDPIVFARIRIPADAQEALVKQIEALTFDGDEFPMFGAEDICDWWPATFENILVSKQARSNGWYIDLRLVKEGDHMILYINYFTF